jgi:hypothetical protein
MTEADIKAAVRERDGFKCRDCGKTNKKSIKGTGRSLQVHRLLPGTEYDEKWCVTLCQQCHARKPRTIDQLFFLPSKETGVLLLGFNLYDPSARNIISSLEHVAKRRGMTCSELMDKVLADFCREQYQDYCI